MPAANGLRDGFELREGLELGEECVVAIRDPWTGVLYDHEGRTVTHTYDRRDVVEAILLTPPSQSQEAEPASD